MDLDLFSHLELTFDLHDNKVTTETAAKDIHGESYYKHILDTATDSAIAMTGTDITHYRPPSETTTGAVATPTPTAP